MIRYALLLVLTTTICGCEAAQNQTTARHTGDPFAQINASENHVRSVTLSQSGDATTGHWEVAIAPSGQQTQVWVPADSYRLPAGPESGVAFKPFNAPRLDQPYTAALGRYHTIRFPDGRLEYEWSANEPSAPQQGFWQILPDQQRVWMPGAQGTASER